MSIMAKNFLNSIRVQRPPSSKFDLSHDVKMSLRMGKLYPTLAMECVPGDRFRIGCESLLRFMPLVTPVMHRMDVTMHYFFVPNRLVWPNWEKYITNNSGATPLPAFPFIEITPTSNNWTPLMGYMGIPNPAIVPNADTNKSISAIPFAAYQLIYNEYYRDQNLVGAVDYLLTDGSNQGNAALTTLRTRAWEHDLFTSSLPFAQKGAAVDIPIADFQNVPVLFNADAASTTLEGTPTDVPLDNLEDPNLPAGSIFANTAELNAEPTTINDLRRAFRLQEWLEKMARVGTRYIEMIKGFFDVDPKDDRLQRPEYITGTKSPVSVSEVLNTTGTEELPQGNMAGHAISVTQGSYGGYLCREHGYIIGIMSVRPKPAYMQGIPKHFLKITDPTEFLFPQFANLGEQPVSLDEIYSYTNETDPWGYLPNYYEYRFMQNRVAGDMTTSLKNWHLARDFENAPALNQTFIECDPSNRIFAVEEDSDNLIAHVYHKIAAIRPLPKYGTPSW